MDDYALIDFGIEPIAPRMLGVTVRIDGVDLRTIAGGGVPIGAETLQTRHWAGRTDAKFAPDPDFGGDDDQRLDRKGVIAVLNCDCGVLDCGGLFTRVRRSSHEVRWTEFRRGLGSSCHIEEICFDERQYFDALRTAKDRLRSHVAVESRRVGP